MLKDDGGPKGPKVTSDASVPSRKGSTQKMSANIKVVVRVRPLNKKELEKNSRVSIDVVDEEMLVFDPKEKILPFYYQGVQQPSKNYLKRANKDLKFVFDHVCGPNATNQYVFESTTKDMLASLMDGYNCSVFVYGATGAGKTFTMIGSKDHPGITYLTMEHLFHTITSLKMEREFDICVSYIEVYNENVYDLLKQSKTPLQLREDAKYGVMVAGLTVRNIKTARELLDMLEYGNRNRTQHPTDANAESSRSHAVFQVYVNMRCKKSNQRKIVELSMIDLAGSERACATGCVGERFKEGANINRSLLALGNCINKLADGSSYIPYRDSKLTRLLKDSLGGNCRTVMIANVSPSTLSYEDTYNTLKYAARANKIQLSMKKNIVDGDMRSTHYVKLNKELLKQNEELTEKLKELRAQLTLSAVQAVKPPVVVDDRDKHDVWIQRITETEASHDVLENKLLTLMSEQRVLALRHFLRTRAFAHVADLAHRSSSDALEQICVEEIPRQERAAESYRKQHTNRNSKITSVWREWFASDRSLQTLLSECLAACPALRHFVERVQLHRQTRLREAGDKLRYKVGSIMKLEIMVSTDCMTDTFSMLKKLYLTLKGYSLVTPSLTAEYLEIINKAKSAKAVSWPDESTDPFVKFISTLELDKPTIPIDLVADTDEDTNSIDLVTDSDDVTDTENRDPRLSAKKRTGTPIKLINNQTIIIDDSLDVSNANNLDSTKKFKRETNREVTLENYCPIDPKDLNSTFVLAGKLVPKLEQRDALPAARPLVDRNNIMHNFNTNNKARIVKPVVPVRRVAVTAPMPRGPAFGSSVGRDGTTLQRTVQGAAKKTTIAERSVGFKAVPARERVRPHPYSRPAAFSARK